MARPQQTAQQRADAQQRFVQTALSIYEREGADAVTFRRIAGELGISHTLAYRHFNNRDALFASMRIECFERFEAVVQTADNPVLDATARMYAIADAVFAWAAKHAEVYRLMFALQQPPLSDYPVLLAVRQRVFNHLVGIVEKGIDAGQIKGDARTIAHLAWASTTGLLSLHAAGQLVHGRDLDALIRPMIQQTIGPLFSDALPHSAEAA